jgi:predicted enzyme related to lactoylglutathione lyase
MTETRTLRFIVNVDVDDLEKAIAFYASALGLRLDRKLFDNSVAQMWGGPCAIYLLLKPPGSAATLSAGSAREYQRHWTPVHLDFVVDDVAAAVARAVSAGAKLEGEIQSFAWGRLATMSDPFGHGFCAVQFLGSGYEEVA